MPDRSIVLDELKEAVAEQVVAAVGDPELLVKDVYPMLERPKDEAHGDYALPCFRFAKVFKKSPKDLALAWSKLIQDAELDLIGSAEAISGFLNITLHCQAVAGFLLPKISDGSYFSRFRSYQGAQPKVMIEYSQPNTHKTFHVGHIRNVALGDSLGRLYEYGGYPVIMVNYLGDEGAHIAKCLWYMQEKSLPKPTENKGSWLDVQYRGGSAALAEATGQEKERIQGEISTILKDIESKSGSAYDLWKETKSWSVADFQSIYDWFGARFDHWFSESEVSEASQEIVDDYLKRGVFIEDGGAVGLDLKAEKLGFVILRKRDGNTLYATKDLALARLKFEEYEIDHSIYVVASEQNLHFKQVFRTLREMGFKQAANCYHLSYGMVTLPEGKMSTRSGNTISFANLKEQVLAELDTYLAKYRGDWTDADIADTAHSLAVGAIRYGMIASDPSKDIVFNMKDWLSFEGNSGPYLMYCFARSLSIISKGKDLGYEPSLENLHLLEHESEAELLRRLNDFNNYCQQALDSKKVSVIAHHLFDMAKSFNRMIAHVKIAKAESAKVACARLALASCFTSLLAKGLEIMGIRPVSRM